MLAILAVLGVAGGAASESGVRRHVGTVSHLRAGQHVDPHAVGLPAWVPITPQIQAEADRGDTWSYNVDAVDPAAILPAGQNKR